MIRRALAAVTGALLVAAVAYPTVSALDGSSPQLPKLDGLLVERLAAAPEGAALRVLVHGRTTAAATAAVERAGLTVLTTFPSIGVAVTHATVDAVGALRSDGNVTFLEADRALTFSMATSHRATRGDEVLSGFDGYKLQPQPDKPGATREECKRVKQRTRDRSGRTRTRTVRRCQTVQDPPVPQPPVEVPARSTPLDGNGVTIAVVDGGVDGNHPMFLEHDGQRTTSRVVRNLKVACLNQTPVFFQPEPGQQFPPDLCPADAEVRDELIVDMTATNDTDTVSLGGHGTHVAGIAGGGTYTATDGRRVHGAAPRAKLVAVSTGYSASVTSADAALDWVLRNKDHPCGVGVPAATCPPIRVVNNSYGVSGGSSNDYDPRLSFVRLSDELVKAGVVMVWAAGNEGGNGSDNRNTAAGQSPLGGAISVANYDDQGSGSRAGRMAASSSRGERGRVETYPDVSAPGTEITSACTAVLTICRGGFDSDPNVGTISGTSMAAPHVAGIVAQLLQANPSLTPAQIEDILEDTAFKVATGAAYQPDAPALNDGTTSYDKGHGLVDAKAAVALVRGMLLREAVPAPPGAVCGATDGQVAADDAGDGSAPSTDVVGARMAWHPAPGAAAALESVVSVADMQDGYNGVANGRAWYVDFQWGGRPFFVTAAQEAVGGGGFDAARFGVGRPEGSIRRTLVSEGVSGTLDTVGEVVRIVLSQQAVDGLNEVLRGEGGQPVPDLADGVVFSAVSVVTFDSLGAAGTGTLAESDTAGGACQFVLSGGARPEPAPEGDDPGPGGPGGPGGDGGPGPGEPRTDGHAALSEGQSWETEGTPSDVQFGYTCEGLGDEGCFTYALDLKPSGEKATLNVAVYAFEAADYDVYVYDADGNEVGSGSGLPATVLEEVSVQVGAGRFYVVVQPYTATPNTPFELEVSLGPPSGG